jgi:hypothetical protein
MRTQAHEAQEKHLKMSINLNRSHQKKPPNKTELLKFLKSLWQRGLLTESPDDFDYEWVIWDYLREIDQQG